MSSPAGTDGQEAELHRHLVARDPEGPGRCRRGGPAQAAGGLAVHHDRALGVGHAVLADRAEDEAGE